MKNINGWMGKSPTLGIEQWMNHIYDVVGLQNKIYIVGAGGTGMDLNLNHCAVFELSEDTSNARLSLEVPAAAAYSDECRLYFAGELNGKLYVQPVDMTAGAQLTSKVFDGSQWTDGPKLLPEDWESSCHSYGYNANKFLDDLIYQGGDLYYLHYVSSACGEILGYPLYAFDGNAARKIMNNVRTYTIYSDKLYVIECLASSSHCNLKRTADLSSWITLSNDVPSEASAVVIAGDHVFVGTADAKVYISDFTVGGL